LRGERQERVDDGLRWRIAQVVGPEREDHDVGSMGKDVRRDPVLGESRALVTRATLMMLQPGARGAPRAVAHPVDGVELESPAH
jgi:hypothetical protein